MDKPFRPAILHPEKYYLSEAYGITDARRLELCSLMAKLTSEQMNCVVTIAHRIDRLADLTETPGEFAFCLHIDTIFLEKNGFSLA
jgi:hypothetical protein